MNAALDPALTTDLLALRDACRAVASQETAYGIYQAQYGPLAGHCQSVAWLVWKRYGGEMIHGEAQGRPWHGDPIPVPHVWNRLHGVDIDLTGDQFADGDGLYLPPNCTGLYVMLPPMIARVGKLRVTRLLTRRVKAYESEARHE